MKKIITIMNFVRGVEPRYHMDLYGNTLNEKNVIDKYGLKSTYLLQYDAMIRQDFAELFKNSSNTEVGIWLEMVRPLVEDSGISWRGRPDRSWDHFAHCDMTVGYTADERRKLVDTCFAKFRDIFGYYPKTVGSWVLDSKTVGYMNEKYGIDAACICREQWGTDGYTLWGGYYNQAYYPSVNNIMCPAQTREKQINVPVFRLLGCDPIYQYDAKWREAVDVCTLEPYYREENKGGGARPFWVDWYFENTFNSGHGLSFAFAQVGQENSFSWEGVQKGFTYQIEKISEIAAKGEVEAMTFSEAGKWFKESFALSPVSSQTATTDWQGQGRKSFWYYGRFFRTNLVFEADRFFFRDVFLFDENYEDIYNDDGKLCKGTHCVQTNLPAVDGFVWGREGEPAGLYFCDGKSGKLLAPVNIDYTEGEGSSCCRIKTENGEITVLTDERALKIASSFENVCLKLCYYGLPDNQTLSVENEKTVSYTLNGYLYKVKLEKGYIADGYVEFEGGEIVVRFSE